MPEAVTIERLSQEALAQFIQDSIDEKTFTAHHVRESDPHLLGAIFLPLLFMEIGEQARQIGTVWADMKKASERGINGYPVFFECHLMHIDDWQIASKEILRGIEEKQARTKAMAARLGQHSSDGSTAE